LLESGFDIGQYRPVLKSRSESLEKCGIAPLVREPLSAEAAAELAIRLKALSDPARLRLMSLIASHQGAEACVCDVSVGLDLSQPTISHHLKVLRTVGLLTAERRGLGCVATTFASIRSRSSGCRFVNQMYRPLLAEFIGTALLVTLVVGSGIAAAQLSPDDVGLQLFENSTATVFGLAVLILMFGPISGAHFNPVVSAADWLLCRRAGTGITAATLGSYTVVQILGGVCGAALANVMFDRRAFEFASKERITLGHVIGEVVATAGLIALIFALARTGRAAMSAAAVGAYIGAAYWFTSSTSFAIIWTPSRVTRYGGMRASVQSAAKRWREGCGIDWAGRRSVAGGRGILGTFVGSGVFA
jgi:glycerol uptake facilitator-like aquaporin